MSGASDPYLSASVRRGLALMAARFTNPHHAYCERCGCPRERFAQMAKNHHDMEAAARWIEAKTQDVELPATLQAMRPAGSRKLVG